ncbi:hypothetical protein HKX54_01540 [Sulfitobacter sp. M57]|uniref:hypothetical protein n=1 Tax=unclassified Sulfitobacter TaxID=196795 RepID=UPI0023E2C05C|nr:MULTISPECIES: hypothetical protein [unclassified Sulfitobacter]MDF3413124.1 hypothetical protein [Sulfitobacter sp. KE5]MDF3421593.1 hypothetical protein [Sulfitobacter sp. KE43]MDF3431673.1 hypothetical protein [Sulfitobacter sp. KE42]MDF3457314.1 hypothetical protein [Sulfitobacter sp. S74]MDF3461216.1 hypothetical protein [Sulfitobacter sp. Ks18]
MSLMLLGCAEVPPVGPEASLLRNPTVAFGGTSRFDAGKFAGDWRTLACIGTCDRGARYEVGGQGVLRRETGGVQRAYQISAPGILRARDGKGTLVVMWVDTGFRTAAVGDADGQFAAILDRGAGSVDRTRAATEILDFNGWDISKLRKIQ